MPNTGKASVGLKPLVPANGYGITGNVGQTPTPAVALTTASGVLGADTPVGNGATVTLITTAALAVGTWLVSYATTFQATVAPLNDCEFDVILGTATATFAGPHNSSGSSDAAGSPISSSCTFLVTVTVAGTLVLQAVAGAAGAGTVKAVSGLTGVPNTGYVAVRIA